MKQNKIHNYARENFVVPFRLWVYRFLRRTLVILILALLANFVFSYLFYTPKMWKLREVNNQIVSDYATLQQKVSQLQENVAQINTRQVDQYSSVFAADTASNPLRYASIPDAYYDNVGYGRYADLMVETQRELDNLSRNIFYQSTSFDLIEALARDKNVMMDHLPTLWPMDRSLMRGHIGAFGRRNDPVYRSVRNHEGIDMAGKQGTPIYATGNGVVIDPKYTGGYGLQVMIDHKFGFKTRYAHLSKILVKPGEWVKRGQIIGLLGNTGKSTGAHLHYEIILRNKPVNPMNYLSRDMSSDEFKDIIENIRATTYEQE